MTHHGTRFPFDNRPALAEDTSGSARIAPQRRVSIGFPVYNGELYLEQAIASLLDQTLQNFELIISDNCSNDATKDICEEFARRDPRVSYYRNDRNLGGAANFNRVVELARGEFFAWANDDDVYAPTYLERCVAELDRCPGAVLAYSRSAKIDAKGALVGPLVYGLGLGNPSPARRLRQYHDLFRDIDRRNGWADDDVEGLWVPVYGVMRTGVLRRTGMLGPYISSDTVLIEELLILGAFAEVDEQLFYKRDHPKRSMRACVSYDKRFNWFSGHRSPRLLFPRWRLLGERLRATLRAPVPVSKRFACLVEMLAYYVRRPSEGRGLIKEILVNGRRLVGGTAGARGALERW